MMLRGVTKSHINIQEILVNYSNGKAAILTIPSYVLVVITAYLVLGIGMLKRFLRV